MARPVKEGLDYFPMDTNIFSDRKIRKLIKTHGCKGIAIFHIVLCEIYLDKGYFVLCDDDFVFDVSDKLNIAESSVEETIRFCISNGLFNKRVFDVNKILTSASIQKRYMTAKRNKVEIDGKLNVLAHEIEVISTETKVISTETLVNVTESTQRKVKKSKIKKSKGEEKISSSVFISIHELLTEYLEDKRVCDAVIKNKRKNFIQDQKHLEVRLKEFVEHLTEQGVRVKERLDFNAHFLNWHKLNHENSNLVIKKINTIPLAK